MGNTIGWSLVKEAGNTEEALEVLRYFSGPKAMEFAVQIRQGEILPHQPTMVRTWLRTQAVPSNRSIFLEALPSLRPLPLIEDSYKNIVSRAAYDFWIDKISEDQAIENMRIGITRYWKPIEPRVPTKSVNVPGQGSHLSNHCRCTTPARPTSWPPADRAGATSF